MTPQELKQQAHKEFDEKFDSEEFPFRDQACLSNIHNFIDSLIDRTVQMTEERIVGIAEFMKAFAQERLEKSDGEKHKFSDYNRGLDTGTIGACKEIIRHLITNKSNINKAKE